MPYDTPPLIGRAALLDQLVRRARAGTGSVLVGPRRSGGTRLLTEATTALRRAGLSVARLGSVPPGTDAFRTFLPLLDRAAAQRVEAAHGARRAPLLRAALLGLGLRILVVEDVALDEDAVHLLGELARHGTALLADATGQRPAPAALPALEALAEDGRLALTPLPPLTEEEVGALAAHLLGGPTDTELTLALADTSLGLPAVLVELVPDATDVLVHADGLWHLTGALPTAPSIRSALRRAFAELSPDQRGWVAAVALAGRLAEDLAPRVAGEATRLAAHRAGWTAQDPRTGVTRLALPAARPALNEALVEGARTAVLRRLVDAHTTADRALEDEERVALARWRIELGQAPDPRDALTLAMLPTTSAADREALLRAAAAGGGPGAHAALAEHLRRTRRPGEALTLIHAALPGATTPAERVQLARAEAMATGVVERRSGEALVALDEHLAEHGPVTDLLGVRAALLLLEGRLRESLDAASAVLEDPARSAVAEGAARMQTAFVLRELGRFEESAAAARRFAAGTRVTQAFPNGEALAGWLPHEIDVAVGLRLDPAEGALRALHDRIPPERRATDAPPAAYTLGSIALHRGDPVEAARLLREADAGTGAWRDGWLPRILAELTTAQALAGALDDAAATYERLLALRCPPVQRGRIGLAGAQLAAVRGDREQAVALALDVATRGEDAGLRLDAFDGAFAAMLHGDGSAADRLLRLGAEPGGPGRDAQRAAARARRGGDPDALTAAAGGLWRAGLRLQAVQVAAAAADAGSAEGDRRLIAWLTRVPDLRLPGVTSGRAGALTTREREVALLASDGRSDRAVADVLGITVRTAQTHLARAYAKLGVHRRTDLRDLVDET